MRESAVLTAAAAALFQVITTPMIDVIPLTFGLAFSLALAFSIAATVLGVAGGTPTAGRFLHPVELFKRYLLVLELALFCGVIARSDVRGMDSAVVEPANWRIITGICLSRLALSLGLALGRQSRGPSFCCSQCLRLGLSFRLGALGGRGTFWVEMIELAAESVQCYACSC